MGSVGGGGEGGRDSAFERDERQGVVAKEFGHLRKGDVKMNMRLIGVLAGLEALKNTGVMVVRATCGRNARKSDGSIQCFGGGG